MLSTTEYSGAVNIEGEPLIRDLKSKAVLAVDIRALTHNRQQRNIALREKQQKMCLEADIQRVNSDINSLKTELAEIKDLLKAALPVFINTNKTNL